MLIDQAKIHVKAGDGGNGCTSFYRDRRVRKGKPNGGPGGGGGNIVLKVEKNIRTLLEEVERLKDEVERLGEDALDKRRLRGLLHDRLYQAYVDVKEYTCSMDNIYQRSLGRREAINNLHLFAAYVIGAFIIVHIYLLTVGHGFREHVKPMVTGYDTIDLTPEQEAYLETNEPGRLKPIKG